MADAELNSQKLESNKKLFIVIGFSWKSGERENGGKSWQSGFNQLQDDSIPENNENICRIQERKGAE